MRGRMLASVLVGGLMLAGCGSKSETPAFPRSGTQTYSTAQQIADDLNGAGFTCAYTSDGGQSKFKADSGRCTVEGRELVLLVFPSDSDQASYETFLKDPLFSGYSFVHGTKWTVNTGSSSDGAGLGSRIQFTALGGDFVSG